MNFKKFHLKNVWIKKHTKALHEKTLFPTNDDKPFIHILGLHAAMVLCFCKLVTQVNKFFWPLEKDDIYIFIDNIKLKKIKKILQE
jgi:hypothetical protein